MFKPKENSLDKTKAHIMLCNFAEINHIFRDYHYKSNNLGGGISVCFAMFVNHKLVGGSVLGKPRHEKKYKNCIDIRRMALIDEAPFNSESFFLSQIIKWITSNTDYDYVLSYSEKTVGHIGTIYKASNFKSIGETTPTKSVEWNGKTYHPRSITIDRDYSYKLREALKTGEAKVLTGLPKIIWLYEINKKNKKKKKIDFGIYDGFNNCSVFDFIN